MSASETSSENAPNSSSYSHSSHLAYMINEVYRSPIEETVDFCLMISFMPPMMSILGGVYIKQSQGERKEAAKLFFDRLLELEDEGKFQSFVDALRQAQYKLLVSAIENKGEIPFSHHEHKQLIGIFFSEIAEIIDPMLVSQELQMKEIISPAEGESIRNAVKNSSRQQAAFELLDKIPHRISNWYEVFLDVLLEQGHKNLVQKIDPKFFDKKTEGLEGEVRNITSTAELSPPSVAQSSTSPLPGSSSRSRTQASAGSSKYVAPKAATTSATAAVNPATQRSSVDVRELNQERKTTELSELKLIMLEQTKLIRSLLSKVELLENKIDNVESKLEVMNRHHISGSNLMK